MDAIGAVIILLGLFATAVIVLVVVSAVKAARAVARKVERTEAQARRAVENVTLRAKSFTKPGPQGELAAVRLGLRTSLAGTREVLAAGVGADGQLAEALGLLDRLDRHAAELDAELRMLEREPQPSRIATKLPELRERADRITHSAESMRWAAQDRMQRFAADELSRLSAECESEAGALRHWDRVGQEPAAGSDGPGAASGTATAAGAGRGGHTASQGGATPSRPGIAARAGRLGAEEMLNLSEPLTRLGQRLRKAEPGSSAS
ncbi:hypothetical protein OG455_26595 [Kitasatospora sp. NBC_01287]|uniref:hypothetical protein n=1 Tax=Kitasatospora sp. NBC_01287 TaxID=2903573 RepID=UPI0022572951|nr:hypothetical protein [Kitasatospora sp. NBC_01287]MCX4749034.1 hypothetical protein [Kitasatospora sp. NBC_01287]